VAEAGRFGHRQVVFFGEIEELWSEGTLLLAVQIFYVLFVYGNVKFL
jgi:hypothetical protein